MGGMPVAAKVGLGVLGGALLGSKSKSSRPKIKTESSLTPEQQALAYEIYKYLQPHIGEGAEPYTGEFVAQPSPAEELGLRRLSEYLQEQWTPAKREELFQEIYAKPTIREVQEEILPLVREAYAGAGTYWGSPRARAEERVLSTLAAELARRRGEFELLAREMPLRQAQAAMQLGSLPRLLQQLELEKRYQEFIRTRPEVSPYLQAALAYIGTPMLAAYGVPAKPSLAEQLLGYGAQLGSAYILGSLLK